MPSDEAGMAETVCAVLTKGDAWQAGCTDFTRRFAWEAFGRTLRQAIHA